MGYKVLQSPTTSHRPSRDSEMKFPARCSFLGFWALLGIISVTGHKINSKQWLHDHCKQYQVDYAALIDSYLSRYSYGLKVDDILGLKSPSGRSTAVVDPIRPIVYIVNNTLHYVDGNLATMEAEGVFSAGFSYYFSPAITKYVLLCHVESQLLVTNKRLQCSFAYWATGLRLHPA